MSFALPLSSLRNIQISCKISLPDGSFSFEMTPIDSEPRYSDNVSVLDAMTLHVISSPGQDGVTLTFFATGGGKYADDPVGLMNSLSVPALEQTPDSVPPNSEQLPLHFPAIGLDESTVPSDNDLEFQESNQIRLLEFLDSLISDNRSNNGSPGPSSCGSSAGASSEWIPYPHFDATHSSPPPSSSWPTPGSATPVPANTDPKSKFQCTLGCDLKFSRRHDRLRHEVAQHGRECEWECPVCYRFFSSQGTLEKHRCVGRRSGSDGGNDFNPARRWVK